MILKNPNQKVPICMKKLDHTYSNSWSSATKTNSPTHSLEYQMQIKANVSLLIIS